MTSAVEALQLYAVHLQNKAEEQARRRTDYLKQMAALVQKAVAMEGHDPRTPLEIPTAWSEFKEDIESLGWKLSTKGDADDYGFHYFISIDESKTDK